jgi:DNA-binding NtrC family response regulator
MVEVVDLFTDALKAAGFQVRGFDDPLMALTNLYENYAKYSVALIDIRIPGMDGFQLSKLIHQMDSGIKIVGMSAFELREEKLKEFPINEFLKKPIHIADLVSVLMNLMPIQGKLESLI